MQLFNSLQLHVEKKRLITTLVGKSRIQEKFTTIVKKTTKNFSGA